MKALTAICIGFAIFAYDLSFNDGQIVRWLGSFLGLA
jgi:hypothetical protein